MNVLLVDDEPLNLENCKDILNSFDIVDNIITFDNPINVIKYIQSNSVDVAILDIEMPVMNGISLAKKLQKISPSTCIIFLTCHSQYALDAFAVDAIDYVLKPIDCNELKKALLKTIPYINQR